jgi:nucleoid DNA-binding protein/cell division septation protein DedD
MDRKEFLEKVSSKIGADVKEVEQVFQRFIDAVTTALRDGEKVNLSNFGTFSPKITKATKKFSALLNREIEIPEKFTISFSPASKVAEDINIKYKDEKPSVIKEATEREIEKKVTIMPPEKEEEVSKVDKFMEEISKFEKEGSEEKVEEVSEEDVSLSAELLEVLKEVEEKLQEKESVELQPSTSEIKETKEEKEEVSQMPEMNLNQEKPKFTFGEDLTSQPVGSGGYQQSFSTSGGGLSPSSPSKEGSGALWLTLIILLIGIIGVGIYWAFSSDVTETKKEPVVEMKKETTSPVVVEKQPPTSAKKQIIIAPEEYSSIPPDTSIKQKTSLLVEETSPEKKEMKKEVVSPTPETKGTRQKETISSKQETRTAITEKVKPIKRKRVATVERVMKKPAVTSQGDYFIQVNSYSEKRFADAFARELRNKGYRAFVEANDVSGFGKMYRVKVGFYLDEDSASKDYHNLRLLLKKEDIFVDRR